MAKRAVSKTFSEFKKEVAVACKAALNALQRLENQFDKSGKQDLKKKSYVQKKKLQAVFAKLEKKSLQIEGKLLKETDRKTETLQKKIEKIGRLKEVVSANNMLLEVKRKDLLQKAEEIETANEALENRNAELLKQKQEIDAQTEQLRLANQQYVEKNQELETQTEALLDQTEYLHEANETITAMHGELARQKDEILQKNEELQTLNNEKNSLIGIVAHDLKSPLNQIKGLVSLVKMTSQLEAEPANCLNMIEASAIRLNTMIGKILDIEAIESRTLNLNIELVNVPELVESLVVRYRLDAAKKNIELQQSAPEQVVIETDRNYITQILENLLSNAIKFSPSERTVYFNVFDKGDHIIAEVRDEGPGLNDEDKKKLFSKYQKLSAKPTGNESSTGLGLLIVKKFTESMQGSIWCESELGKGASFFVRFRKRMEAVLN